MPGGTRTFPSGMAGWSGPQRSLYRLASRSDWAPSLGFPCELREGMPWRPGLAHTWCCPCRWSPPSPRDGADTAGSQGQVTSARQRGWVSVPLSSCMVGAAQLPCLQQSGPRAGDHKDPQEIPHGTRQEGGLPAPVLPGRSRHTRAADTARSWTLEGFVNTRVRVCKGPVLSGPCYCPHASSLLPPVTR